MATMWLPLANQTLFDAGRLTSCGMTTTEYCCPIDSPLYECKWRGSAPECVDANCLIKDGNTLVAEVQIDSGSGGDSLNHCSCE